MAKSRPAKSKWFLRNRQYSNSPPSNTNPNILRNPVTVHVSVTLPGLLYAFVRLPDAGDNPEVRAHQDGSAEALAIGSKSAHLTCWSLLTDCPDRKDGLSLNHELSQRRDCRSQLSCHKPVMTTAVTSSIQTKTPGGQATCPAEKRVESQAKIHNNGTSHISTMQQLPCHPFSKKNFSN
ncbi:hypothetical protein O181_002464 [Austropuccinia psidii MF-1]|uniref:Uncharacterized protein n=1 Tax=Austropuccinia psidii MF-1 TaxID=1389203 RepID=A0A9Q3BCB2_9BASI|nr:hypothetical protein [Austropuccinia psidii MF-1]